MMIQTKKPPNKKNKKRRVSELVESLEKPRRRQRRLFTKMIRRLREIYGMTKNNDMCRCGGENGPICGPSDGRWY